MDFGRDPGFATKLVHAGEDYRPSGSVTMPIFNTASFVMDDKAQHDEVRKDIAHSPYYTRGYNPTVAALEGKLAAIDNAEDALAFSNGMGAITTSFIALLRYGGHILASDKSFETTTKWLRDDVEAIGAEITFTDFSDLDNVRSQLRPNTKVLFFEPFTNPLVHVLDIEGIVQIAHEANAVTLVDNTFASPVLFRPVDYGADLVVHSATKYMSGHGTVLGGALAGSAELIRRVGEQRRRLGSIATPFNASFLLEGLKTMELRVERESQSALQLARLADAHDATAEVWYPGLAHSPGHDLARSYNSELFGGMFAFTLRDMSKKPQVYDAFRLIVRATSLGDVKSLVDAVEDPEVLRISVGVESPEDLAHDLTQALDAGL